MDNELIGWAITVAIGAYVIACVVAAVIIVYRGWGFLQVKVVSGVSYDNPTTYADTPCLDRAAEESNCA